MASITESFFAGGQARALAQANPAGAFSQAFLAAKDRGQQDRQFQQRFAEQQRQFDVGTGLKQDELKRLWEKDRSDAAFKRVPSVTERLETIATTFAEFEQQGKPIPEALKRIKADTIAEAAVVYTETGDPDGGGRANRTFDAVKTGEASLSMEEFKAAKESILKTIDLGMSRGDEKEHIAAIISASYPGMPGLQPFALSALDVAQTQQELAVNAAESQVAGAEALLRGAEQIPGVSRKGAERFAGLGEPTAAVQVQIGQGGEGGTPTKPNLSDLQDRFEVGQSAKKVTANLRSFVEDNPGVIGLLGALSRTPGGFAQNIPGLRQLADMFPSLRLDEASVTAAKRFQSMVLNSSALLAPLVTVNKNDKVAQQQIERLLQALQAGETLTTPGAVFGVLDDIDALADMTSSRAERVLKSMNFFVDQADDAGGGDGGGGPAPSSELIGEEDIPVGVRHEATDEAGNGTGEFFIKREDGVIVQVP
jgi:hypothetical protein